MATIEKRTSLNNQEISYRVKVRLKGFPVQTATFERLTDARKWVQQTESAIREGRHFKTTEAKRHTLAEAIDRYIKFIIPTKPKSKTNQIGQLKWWREKLGTYSLADISPALIGEHRDKLSNNATPRNESSSPATVNHYLAVAQPPIHNRC